MCAQLLQTRDLGDIPAGPSSTVPARDRLVDTVDLSLVIPIYNEEGSIPELYEALSAVLSEQGCTYEILFIDDGSRDTTFTQLSDLHHADSRVRVIRFRRNFGKTAALAAGFTMSSGEVVITMDADLQDDPREIPRFLDRLAEGYDLVSGWKKKRHDPLSKTLPSKIFNAIVSSTTHIPLHDFNNGFKAYRREVTEELKLYGELHRFIPVLAFWKGYRIGELDVQHHARKHGKSKFGASRFTKGMLDFFLVLFLTKYMQRPLRLFGGVGVLLATIGVCISLYLTLDKLITGASIGARPLLQLGVLLIVTGVQVFSLGLIGEMLRHFSFRHDEEYSIKQVLD
ncbi:MAG: glycosyltransferase family 2 protein [Chloroflexota bacterium]